ncbi:hypothetical protein EC973_009606 [Apophysomyces ossiformis]|uniref:Uncharacterized protein n=1 Tax=Apophysomyces ossiformis TaxID=679940 RepID=A0A8H7BNU4_9FUNG|nr:hypothetical protein EC973_009606 [Apophysomyces ossiformis]
MNCGRIWLDTIFNNSQELESVFYGDRLVNLSLCPETQQDLQTLSELRALEELSIRNESFSRPLMISYSYLEKLHTNLTCLRSLELRRIEPSGEALTDITVCDTVRRLRLGSESSRMWNPYFARKYSHLEDLELCVREIRTNMSTKEALTAASCRRLKRFACQHFDCRLWFLESLHAIRAPVEELRFGFREADLLSKSIHCYYQTLTKIIFSNAYGIPVPQLVKQLTACRHLTDLSLFSASEAMELDLILDELNGLEHVHLEAKQIELSKHRTQITHRQLKKVNFSVQDADSQVWTYLSQYCPCILSIDCTYGKDMTSSTVMYYLNPGLRYLKVEARGICLYKLVQISEEERIRNQNMDHRELIEKHDDAGSTNWYPSDEFSKRYGLLYLETSKGDSLLHGSYNDAGNQGELGSLPVIYIVCHYPDEISIEHHKLYN